MDTTGTTLGGLFERTTDEELLMMLNMESEHAKRIERETGGGGGPT